MPTRSSRGGRCASRRRWTNCARSSCWRPTSSGSLRPPLARSSRASPWKRRSSRCCEATPNFRGLSPPKPRSDEAAVDLATARWISERSIDRADFDPRRQLLYDRAGTGAEAVAEKVGGPGGGTQLRHVLPVVSDRDRRRQGPHHRVAAALAGTALEA